MTGDAPEGYHTSVYVRVWLENGTYHHASWTTHMALARGHAKGPAWIRDVMREQKVRGRSKIRKIEVTTEYVKGPQP